jgi:glucose/mannose-6-phosphate isomerase
MIVGMGGSGIAGNFAAAVGEGTGSRITVHKGYGPPPAWILRNRPLVIGVSYSGNTEETVDFVSEAHEMGSPVVTVTTGGRMKELSGQYRWPIVDVPGGLQPRAAIGYLFGAVMAVLETAGANDDQTLNLVEAADVVDRATADGSKEWDQSDQLAEQLAGKIPIVYGGGPISGAAAQRWKTQINENAKTPAWWSNLPELDHNELVGWESMAGLTKDNLTVVPLTDRSDHERIGLRFAHSRALTEHAVLWTEAVGSVGTSPLARLMSLTAIGDLVSWKLAKNAGVDPTPVTTIEELKSLLAEDK